METFSISLHDESYQIYYHLHVSNFLIIQEGTFRHSMILQPDKTWRCIHGTEIEQIDGLQRVCNQASAKINNDCER